MDAAVFMQQIYAHCAISNTFDGYSTQHEMSIIYHIRRLTQKTCNSGYDSEIDNHAPRPKQHIEIIFHTFWFRPTKKRGKHQHITELTQE